MEVMTLFKQAGIAAAILVASLPCVQRARAADPTCASLPHPVLGIGGSAQTPLIGAIAAKLAGAASPITIEYAQPGACNAMLALDPSGGYKITDTVQYWTTDGKAHTCTLPTGGAPAQFGSMQNWATLCPNVTKLYDGIGDFQGPIGTVNFIVPVASTQTSFSADAAYFVFGFGDNSKAAPWTNKNLIYNRDALSAVQLYVALASGVPATKFLGVDAKKNSTMINYVATGSDKEATIGFVSGENADGARNLVRTLAYQHTGQACGYWPDSGPNAYDKINVRTGQYYLWAPTHFYAPVDSHGAITDPDTAKFIGYISGAVAPPPELPILDVFIDNGNVPQCAMTVKRTADLGPIASYQPDAPCGCYFENRATGNTSCDPCKTNHDCSKSSPVCRRGFCEVK
jgi:hypothetical protein